MRTLSTLGLVAIAFGLASRQVLDEWNAFNVANLALGSGALALAAGLALRRFGTQRHSADRGPLLDSLLMAIAVTWMAVLVQVAAANSGLRFDWTFEQRFALSPATTALLARLESPLRLTLYYTSGDPRRRSTRILLEQVGELNRTTFTSEIDLYEVPDDEDHYGIGSSNSVVVEYAGRWQLVERPTEGSLFEAISQLSQPIERIVYTSMGAGEGDLERTDDLGYSGLRAALETEGFEVRPLPLAVLDHVPDDADLLLTLAPRRRLRDPALVAIRRYLERGGRLLAFLEPGVASGIEEVLDEYGLHSPDAVVIDPNSGPVEGDAAGLNPIAFNYAEHPVTRHLNRNRMTFFRRTRSFVLRKPRPDDRVRPAVHASGAAWLYDDPTRLARRTTPERPPGARADYYPIVVTGSYPRERGKARIVAFGDSELASNRYLRSLYNLDLVMNAAHWVTEHEPAITLRPKSGSLLQFPVPIQRSLNALYGVGLFVPEMLVLMGAYVYLRRRIETNRA